MAANVFEVNNSMVPSHSNVFYLESKTADVKFIFGAGTNHVETVPAHKNILAMGSPTFRTMFYGSLPQQGDIPMVDASAAAFKEFLQFFYMRNVRLTRENIIKVTSLCHKYKMVEALRLCEEPLQKSLTIEEMCSGYAFATLLELKSTERFCEQKIIAKTEEIFKSTSFLECKREILDKIIQLTALKEPSVIVNGCMAWAKAALKRNNLNETATNLKAQLGQSLKLIPFAGLKMQQFKHFITEYNGLLDESVQAEIISKFTERERQHNVRSNNSRIQPRNIRTHMHDIDYIYDYLDDFDPYDYSDDLDNFDPLDYFD